MMQLFLGKIHGEDFSVLWFLFLSVIKLISLLSHRIFLRAEGYAERIGELFLKRINSNVNNVLSSVLNTPIEL